MSAPKLDFRDLMSLAAANSHNKQREVLIDIKTYFESQDVLKLIFSNFLNRFCRLRSTCMPVKRRQIRSR